MLCCKILVTILMITVDVRAISSPFEEATKEKKSRQVKTKSRIKRGIVNGAFYEGDIAIDVQNDSINGPSVQHAWLTAKDKLWPEGIIYYQIDTSSIPNKDIHRNISLAVKEITDCSCLVFNQIPPLQEPSGDFLYFRAHGDVTHDGVGCWSYMGRKGGQQVINIPAPHCTSVEVITHEILHATGALHEHNRPDRDSHIKILYENIKANMRNNFVKQQWEYDNVTHGVENFGTSYDLYSILHYPFNAHGINDSVATIVSLESNGKQFGSRGQMTITDQVELNLNYGCPIDSHLLVNYLHEAIERSSVNSDVVKVITTQTYTINNHTDMIRNITEKQEKSDSKIKQQELLNDFTFESIIQNIQDLKNDFEKCEKQQNAMTTTINEMSKLIDEQQKYVQNVSERKENIVKELVISKLEQAGCINGKTTMNLMIKDRYIPVRCEDALDQNGAWTVIQRRGQFGNPHDYFDKQWSDYETGFGSVYGEIWLGLKNIADLTTDGEWQLQVDLTDWNGKKYFALYNKFIVGPGPRYGLGVSEFDNIHSTLGDSLASHNSMAFSTKDKDQDIHSSNCAVSYKGGWWYHKCHASSLNSLNYNKQISDTKGITWNLGKTRGNNRNTWKESVMKIRRVKSVKDCINGMTKMNTEIEGRSVSIRCEDGRGANGAWTVIQRRGQYGNPDDYFDKTWSEYITGFGSVYKELWLGLQNIADLTKEGEWQLQVDLTDWDGKTYFALYNSFAVGPGPHYGLGISHFDNIKSTLGDSLAIQNSMSFTTKDNDQDIHNSNCAVLFKGGWWYEKCHHSSLNSLNYNKQVDNTKGITWYHGKARGQNRNTWQASTMKIRRVKNTGCADGLKTVNMIIKDFFVQVQCEDARDQHGAWTVIQRRGQFGNSQNYFDKTWDQYVKGFGSVHKELWLGLQNIAELTKDGKWQLQVDLTDWNGQKYFALYNSFTVGPGPYYGLGVSGFDNINSTLGDSLASHNSMGFSTKDNDQDIHSTNCAADYKGGWWYEKCHSSSLNSLNYNKQISDTKGITWNLGKARGDNRNTWQASIMKIRRVNK